jgi:hypothetical protein
MLRITLRLVIGLVGIHDARTTVDIEILSIFKGLFISGIERLGLGLSLVGGRERGGRSTHRRRFKNGATIVRISGGGHGLRDRVAEERKRERRKENEIKFRE